MTGIEAYLLAMAYTKKAIEGAGALKGAACQIKSIAPITGGNRVTFLWEDNEGVQSEDYMDVMNGADGAAGADGTDGTDGVGISSITFKEKDVDGNNVYTVTLTNSNTYDIVCPKGSKGDTGSTGATGNGIASIEKTGTEGLVDTYTITYTSGATTTFTVTNGASVTVDSAMSDSSTNPVQNRVITGALAGKTDTSVVGTVESSATASKAYAANAYLVLSGVLYRVTSDIASGGTIVTSGAGQNVVATTITAEMEAVEIDYEDWIELTPQQQETGNWFVTNFPATPVAPVNYSTSEVNTGVKWIDGKDVYRKVVTYDSAIPVGNNTIPVTNLETLINSYGCVSNDSGASGVVMPYEAMSAQNKLAISSYSSSGVTFSVGTAYQGQYAMNYARIVLEYTKSTT